MSTKHAVLGLISFGPQSGYTMKHELEEGGLQWIWDLSYGSIYPKLESLSADGLIKPVEVQATGRERTTYELTARGWAEMDRWLAEPSEYPLPLRDELLLRLLFWGTVRPDDRATLREQLLARRRMCDGLLARLLAPRNPCSAADEYHSILERYAQLRLKAELAWIDEAVSQLDGPPREPLQDPYGLFERARQRRAAAEQEG